MAQPALKKLPPSQDPFANPESTPYARDIAALQRQNRQEKTQADNPYAVGKEIGLTESQAKIAVDLAKLEKFSTYKEPFEERSFNSKRYPDPYIMNVQRALNVLAEQYGLRERLPDPPTGRYLQQTTNMVMAIQKHAPAEAKLSASGKLDAKTALFIDGELARLRESYQVAYRNDKFRASLEAAGFREKAEVPAPVVPAKGSSPQVVGKAIGLTEEQTNIAIGLARLNGVSIHTTPFVQRDFNLARGAAQDTLRLQQALNVLAEHYRMPERLPETGIFGQRTVEMLVALKEKASEDFPFFTRTGSLDERTALFLDKQLNKLRAEYAIVFKDPRFHAALVEEGLIKDPNR